jgi:rRNA maturation RNase YbeY
LNTIVFYFQKRKIIISKSKQIKQLIKLLFKKEEIPLVRLDYIFCSDEYLLGLNKKFLKHNYYNDTLTFYLNEPNYDIRGEIYISLDRVQENSNKFKVPIQEELLRVIIHGALHLCGFNDKTPREKRSMMKLENDYMNQFKYHVSRET